MRDLVLSFSLVFVFAACGSSGNVSSTDGGPGGAADKPQEVTLTTDDGIELIADLYTTGNVGDPGVILLHMMPPSNSKANYPSVFIDALVAQGFNVLNVNRRGAPGSQGVAREAYTGPNGKLDAKAAYDFLTAHEAEIAPGAVAVVGASNGTTTAIDLSVFAANDANVEQPAALVLLSGGTYTENQSSIGANLDILGTHPIRFAYPASEAAWNEEIKSIAPSNWTFSEYSPGSHGTGLFSSNPESIADIAAFLQSAL